jgi:hypothetical protein
VGLELKQVGARSVRLLWARGGVIITGHRAHALLCSWATDLFQSSGSVMVFCRLSSACVRTSAIEIARSLWSR